MKKKLLSLIFAICFIVPAMFCLSGCVKDKNPPVTYIVQFYNYDGTLVKEVSVEENTSATCELPTKESTQYYVYEFSNWEFLDGTDATEELESVTKTLIVRAKFNEVQPTYTINFYDEDGQTLLDTKEVLRGEDSTFITNPTKDDDALYSYEFDCWLDKNNNEVENLDIVQSNINLYAKYNNIGQHSFVVKFYAEDEQTLLKEEILANGTTISYNITKPTSIDGYVYDLDCWKDSEGNKVTSIQKNIDLYPVFGLNVTNTINYLKYSISEDETYYTLGANTKITSSEVRILSHINSIPVTQIEGGTFNYSSSLTKIEIPNTITSVGNMAFYECENLTDVIYLGDINDWVSIEFSSNPLSNGGVLKIGGKIVTNVNITTATIINVRVFDRYKFLENVTIGNSVTEIRNYAFDSSGLKSVNISGSVEKIGRGSFYDCKSLTSATINCALIEEDAFSGSALETLTIGENVTSVCDNAFYRVYLTTVNYLGDIDSWVSIDFADAWANPIGAGDTVLKINGDVITNVNITTATEIKKYAFSNYNKLTSVTIGDSVTSIGSRAFEGCSLLSSLYLGNSVTNVDYGAFIGTSITSIRIPAGIKEVTASMFTDCNKLNTLIVADASETRVKDTLSKESITKLVVESGSFRQYELDGNTNIKILEFNGRRVANWSFRDFTSLEIVILGENVEEIGQGAFCECVALKEVQMSDNLKIINAAAFKGCENLTTINMSKSIENIEAFAFLGCSKIKSIYLSETLIYLGDPYYTNASKPEDYYVFDEAIVIYCGAETNLETWKTHCLGNIKNVKYGYTYEEYLAEINAIES